MKSTKVRTVVFISNFFNHHQKPFSHAMYDRLGDGYLFIQTRPMSSERKRMGWGFQEYPDYVITEKMLKDNLMKYMQFINDADVVIIGSAPEGFIEERKKKNKLIFRYSERPLKKGLELWKYPVRFYKWHKNNYSKNIYMLCASAYTAADYAKFGLFKNKCFKWGYFPEVRKYDDIDYLIQNKKNNSILWCGRFIDWKHPEKAVLVAEYLKKRGIEFQLNMIGTGDQVETIKCLIKKKNLENEINLLGSMPQEEVRMYMEKSEIFLFTSDFQEGWGAVLNEAMNSGCACVASHAIGSAPYLLQNEKNGIIFPNECNNILFEKVEDLMLNEKKRKKLALNAYDSMHNLWNAKIAVNRFLNLAETLLNGGNVILPESGPCSRPENLQNNWWYINEK